MRFLIGSDIHGSIKYANLFFEKFDKHACEKIILLGDLYYNGARNDPPEGYAPKEVVKLLNSYAGKLLVAKGNCESEVDQMVSSFTINDSLSIFAFDKVITCVHGHHKNMNDLPIEPGDVFLQGHTHISVLEKKDNLILGNPGSISLPKDEHHSYMVMDDSRIYLYDLLNDQLLKSISF